MIERDRIEDLNAPLADDHERLVRVRLQSVAENRMVVGDVGADEQDRVGAGVPAEHQGVVALVAVGLLGRLVHADHPPPDDARLVPADLLVEQVRPGVRGMVRLLGVVGEELPLRREGHSVDFGVGARLVEMDVLVDVGQARTERADPGRSYAVMSPT